MLTCSKTCQAEPNPYKKRKNMKRIFIPLSIVLTLSANAENTYPNQEYQGLDVTADGQEIIFSYVGAETLNFTDFRDSKLHAKNNGTINMEANSAYLVNTSISIDNTSALNSAGMSLTDNSSIENHGTTNINYLQFDASSGINYGIINDTAPENELLKLFNESTFTNYGDIKNDVAISITQGSAFYAEDGSSMCSLDVGEWYLEPDDIVATGTIYIGGNVNMYGELGLYEYGEIVFTLDSTLNMNGYEIIPDGGTIILQLDEELTDTTVIYKKDFFTNYRMSQWDEETESWVDYSADNLNVVVRGTNGVEKTMSMKHLAIPEPTTATLSLLALTGLAARRRRK